MAYGRRRQAAGATDRRDRQQEVTDRIIGALEQGTLPWRQPWDPGRAGHDMRPRNVASGRLYRGINILLLAMDERAWSSGDHRWCTYEQARANGWQVRKGEAGTTVFFVGQAPRKEGARRRCKQGLLSDDFSGMLAECCAAQGFPLPVWRPAASLRHRNLRTGPPRGGLCCFGDMWFSLLGVGAPMQRGDSSTVAQRIAVSQLT
ncbi:hypothetical protein FHR90_003313 [Endobacter medicaginis]|uniref:ArdC family protein n=1 Tax=Endobacter medicaginis TaxID=1181271 RepID=A0A839UZX7_9PROT|nr:ArdC family protein [Endobacter medicaginis]MBB3175457.1 hypothetical protein [Endobacter medicaginis]MCX5476927.1 ArdC family protein [Endobacter medicaginis]NVN29028.1 ArdC family protein [Endobacter medicaginis]